MSDIDDIERVAWIGLVQMDRALSSAFAAVSTHVARRHAAPPSQNETPAPACQKAGFHG